MVDSVYSCGEFYKAFSLNSQNIDILKTYQKLELDFDTLGYIYEEIDISDKILSPDEWKVAFFEEYKLERNGMHFFRQTKNGVWWHKKRLFKLPTNLDEKGNVVTDLINYIRNDSSDHYCNMDYQKTY